MNHENICLQPDDKALNTEDSSPFNPAPYGKKAHGMLRFGDPV